MASIPQDSAFGAPADVKPLGEQVRALVKPLASLKITVTVFSLSLFLILVGSLAQARTDVWEVVGQYFRCWIAWVDVRDFFPPSFFPGLIDYKWDELMIRRFPFPGGWLLGLIATINLLAAHGLRFKIQAKGTRLVAGLVTLVIGLVVTWVVVAGGMNADGFQTEPLTFVEDSPALKKLMPYPEAYHNIWLLFKFAAGVLLVWTTWSLMKIARTLSVRALVLCLSVVALALVVVNEPLSDPSMRILWQLMKAQFASFVLLWACWLLFKKRAAVVLLHAGVAVLMLSEVLVGLTVNENRFQMWEGDTANYVFDLRERELVIVDNSGEKSKVVSIPEKLIVAAAASEDDDDRTIRDDRLPFDIEVVQFYRNSTLRNAKKEDKNLATAGLGLKVFAEKAKAAGGMDSKSDESAAYVRIRDKESGSPLGTYMLAMRLEDQAETVLIDGGLYDMSMRFKRTYKPYTVKLLDVEKNDYLGTTTPRDYASTVLLTDPENNVEREVRIWMNNPLRYRGETLYQTDYFKNEETGAELSSLQVVNNRGWMLPYMACMIVLTGMALQFGMALKRYSDRRSREVDAAFGVTPATSETAAQRGREGIGLALVVALIVAGYFGSKFRPPTAKENQPDLYAFGKTPVVKGGRQQPLSSVAMNRMRVLTNGKTTFHRELRAEELKEDWDEISQEVAGLIPGMKPSDLKDFEGGVPELITFISAGSDLKEEEVYQRLSKRGLSGNSAITRRAPAMWWMLDLISKREEVNRHRVIRIDQPQVLSVLRLEQPREGAMYSLGEVMEHFGDEKVEKAIAKASKQFEDDADRAEPFQRRLLALATKVGRITQTRDVFSSFEFDTQQPHSSLLQALAFKELLERMGGVSDSALALQIPRPAAEPGEEWDALPLASIKYGLVDYANSHGKKDIEGLVDQLIEQLPTELVDVYLAETVARLKPGIDEDNDLNRLAGRVIPTLQEEDFQLRQALTLIRDSDKDNAAAILEAASDAQKDRLYEVGAAAILLNLRGNVSSETSAAVQEVFGDPDAVTKESVTELARRHVTEVAMQLVTDAELADGPSGATERLTKLVSAWKTGDTEKFNTLAVEHPKELRKFSEQQAKLADDADAKAAAAPIVNVSKTGFEAWFNHAAPSYYCAAMYLIAFAIACTSLVVWPEKLGRVAFVMTLVTFVFHTFALCGRVYISGRPPVTNLYSSAIFIGWGAVLLGLIFEFVNRRGIGNLVSTAAGAATLVIAYFLGKDGDTFEVLQAVLDTQFWLATHVVCITLGYSATFLAGLFGMVYIVKGVFTDTLRESDRKELTRMVYGTICFAMLFSFVGTILGGLWADDSWGRFWGWDPKENGAMMIVIWNAIVMHARWDNMVKDRGMAVLSVVGNIVTAWSWFGVNELRAGLHSYGFTEGRLFWLNMWVLLNLVFLVIGLLPKDWWRSFRKDGEMNIA